MNGRIAPGFEPIATVHWSMSAPPSVARPALEETLSCDVAIIGAGYTGLTAALLLAQTGRSVMVLDAGEPGWAASGRNAGQVLPMIWGARRTPQQISAAVGASLGERMNRMIAHSGRALFDLIEQQGIECDAKLGFLGLVRTQKSWNRQLAIMQQWSEVGGRYVPIERNQLSRYIVSARYAGGFYFPEGGHVNPLSLSRGLASALERAGGRIFDSSRALSVQSDGPRWRVVTARGVLRCETILVGAGAYTDTLFPGLRKIGYPVLCGAVATDPLPDCGASILPGGIPVADFDDPAVFGPRIDAQGCLVVSFLLGPSKASLAGASKIIGPRLHRAFPGFTVPPFKRLWVGRFLISRDGMPRLLRLNRNIYAAAVCNGLGHTIGMSAARELAKLAMGVAESDLSLPVGDPDPFPASALLPLLLRRVAAPLANRFGA